MVLNSLHLFVQVTELAFDTSSCAVRVAVFQVMHLHIFDAFNFWRNFCGAGYFALTVLHLKGPFVKFT